MAAAWAAGCGLGVDLDVSMAGALLALAAACAGLAVAAGVCSYAASVLALWAMAGRPEGAESFAIGWLRERFAIAVMGRRG